MQRAAIGIRPHSGWAAAVVVSGGPGAIAVISRRRIVVAAEGTKGASQPYHFAKALSLPDAERYLARCAEESERLARAALVEMISEARGSKMAIGSCAILLAAGRPLPRIESILASHALIHTAEGEFFRQCFRDAGERLRLSARGMRERDLEELARNRFGAKAESLKRELESLGRAIGPPWTSDQKNASLAALLALAGAAV
jgi:hypothetical protein